MYFFPMEILWAPWRIEYILGPKPDACVFCIPEHTEEDAKRLILHRGTHAFVVMNKYPYNSGHLLITPYRHIMDFSLLTVDETAEIMYLLQQSTEILQGGMKAQGMNVGLNLGEAAGAGIREHLHFHVVPRWNGDSSFMAVMTDIRTIPQHLTETYTTLKPCFSRLAHLHSKGAPPCGS